MTDFYAPEDPDEEMSDEGFGGAFPEPDCVGDHSYTSVQWPGLRWRGDLMRRHLTAGTIVSILANNGGGMDEGGVSISTIELELRRIAHKYSAKDSGDRGYGKTINGDLLHSEISYIRPIIHGLVFISTYAEYVDEMVDETDLPTDTTKVRLTEEGAVRHEGSFVAAMSDARFEHLDSDDGMLELDVTSADEDPDTLVETLGVRESTLPIRRMSKAKPSYREWLWIIANNPITYAVLRNDIDPATPEIYTEGSVEGSEHIVAAFTASQIPRKDGADHALPMKFWATRVQAEFIRPFALQVLSGGPDAMWIAKPVKPGDIHKDIESFIAASRPGFADSDDMSRRSSLAWELFDTDEFPLAKYKQLRMDMDAAQLELSTITVSHVPPLGSVVADAEAAGVTVSGDDVLDSADLKVDKRGVIGLPSVEKLVMKKSSDALMDSVLGRNVANPGDALRPGKLLRVRCDYVMNAKRPDGRRACDRWAVGGSTRCETHGGEYLNKEETISLLNASRTKLIALQSKAIDTVADMMENSTNDAVKLAASKLILDRTGFGDSMDININTGPSVDRPAGEIIAERLANLAPRAKEIEAASPERLFDTPVEPEHVETDYSPIDAEVVDE